MNINNLPYEILSRIFLFTSPNEWFRTISKVCDKWQLAMNLVWEHVCHLEYDEYKKFLTLNDGRRLAVAGKSTVRTRNVGKEDYPNLEFIIVKCGRSLRSIHLGIFHGDNSIRNEEILHVGINCKKLQRLTLTGNVLSKAAYFGDACRGLPNLEQITIKDECNLSDPNHQSSLLTTLLETVIVACRHLRHVEIFTFGLPPDFHIFDGLALLNLKQFHFTFLKPTSPTYVEHMLSRLIRCSNDLHSLDLFGCLSAPLNGHDCQHYLEIFGNDKQIETFGFGFQLVDEQQLDVDLPEAPWTDFFMNSLTHFCHLRTLILHNFDFSYPSVFATLNKVAPQLTSLELNDNYNVSDSFFFSWGIELPKLETFSLTCNGFAHDVSHESLIHFVSKCSKLSRFNLTGFLVLSCLDLVCCLRKLLHGCHICGTNERKPSSPAVPSLSMDLDISSAKELQKLQNHKFCGLKFINDEYSSVEIVKVCSNKRCCNCA